MKNNVQRPFTVGDTVECCGDHDGCVVHPEIPFRFVVASLDAFRQPVDDRGFVHYPPSCKIVSPSMRHISEIGVYPE